MTIKKKIISLILAISLVLSVGLLAGFADADPYAQSDTLSIGFSGEIVSFAPLDEDVEYQTAPVGTPEQGLNLPDTLLAEVVPENGEPTDYRVPVAWQAYPEFDGFAGGFVFTATIGVGFTLADNVAAPTITVTVDAMEDIDAPAVTEATLNITSQIATQFDNRPPSLTPSRVNLDLAGTEPFVFQVDFGDGEQAAAAISQIALGSPRGSESTTPQTPRDWFFCPNESTITFDFIAFYNRISGANWHPLAPTEDVPRITVRFVDDSGYYVGQYTVHVDVIQSSEPQGPRILPEYPEFDLYVPGDVVLNVEMGTGIMAANDIEMVIKRPYQQETDFLGENTDWQFDPNASTLTIKRHVFQERRETQQNQPPIAAGDSVRFTILYNRGAHDVWGQLNVSVIDTEQETPVITISTHPASTTVTEGTISGNLSVAASVTESATLSYQWQQETTTDNWDNVGTNSATFAIPTGLTAGTHSFRVVVSATGGAVSATSNVATVTVNAPTPTHVPVTDITGVPTTATAGIPLTLSGTVIPSNATNQTITWSVQSAGDTGASISGSTLNTTAAGTVTIRATITNGLTETSNYTQDFTITVNPADTPDLCADGHAWSNWIVTTPPTATTPGVETRTCSVCGNTETREIPAIGNGQQPPPSADRDRDNGRNGGGIIDRINGLIGRDPVSQPLNQGNAVSEIRSQINAHTGDTVTATFRNISTVTRDIFAAMANAGGNRTIRAQFDSMIGNSVDVRITVNPALVTAADSNLYGSTRNAQAVSTRNHFDRFFGNNIMVVSLGQQGSFSQEVRIAARLIPNLNTDNLYFYAFDREANTYRRIPAPNYWLDPNGFIHFSTTLAGHIIISDGELMRR